MGRIVIEGARLDELSAMWLQGARAADIAARFGIHRQSVYDVVRRAGLPPRQKGWKPGPREPHVGATGVSDDDLAEECRVAAARAAAAVDRLCRRHAAGAIMVPPGWSLVRDLDVLASGGCYEVMNRLALDWGVPFPRVVARWHVVRAV